MNEILITGGAGFIGVNLVKALLTEKVRVRVLDNLSAGRAWDLQGLPVELLIGDIRDAQMVARAVRGVQVVVHLAAHTGVVGSVANPEHDLSVNVAGTLNLLQAARRYRVERFLFASSAGAIWGEDTPAGKEAQSPGPLSPYGAGKLAGEAYCSAFWHSYGLKTTSLRLTNVFGPYSYHKGSVIAEFCRRLQASRELIVYGDGEQTRDFLYVADLVMAILTVLKHPRTYGRAIQVRSGRRTSIQDLLRLLRRVVGEERFPPIRYMPARPGEIRHSLIHRAREENFLPLSPPTDLLTGLQRTWEWFRQETGEAECTPGLSLAAAQQELGGAGGLYHRPQMRKFLLNSFA